MTRRFNVGDRVRVTGWGLTGLVLKITAFAEDEYYNLAYEHNGNAVPSNWHELLLRPA